MLSLDWSFTTRIPRVRFPVWNTHSQRKTIEVVNSIVNLQRQPRLEWRAPDSGSGIAFVWSQDVLLGIQLSVLLTPFKMPCFVLALLKNNNKRRKEAQEKQWMKQGRKKEGGLRKGMKFYHPEIIGRKLFNILKNSVVTVSGGCLKGYHECNYFFFVKKFRSLVKRLSIIVPVF